MVIFITALAAAIGVAVLSLPWARWNLVDLILIGVYTVCSDLTSVWVGDSRLRVSGTSLGIVLAAVLLGPAPAMLVGIVTISIGWLRSREAGHYFRSNLANFAWHPLLGALAFGAGSRIAGIDPRDPAFYLLALLVLLLTSFFNFLGVAGYQCYLDRSSLYRKTVDALVPVLSAELFSALLVVAALFSAVKLGTQGILLAGVFLIVFQYLISELLKSKHRGEQLERLATTDTLTGLANRDLFRERVESLIGSSVDDAEPFSVLLIDLDRFKEINDTLGHHYGDEVLRELGPRLTEAAGPGGLVARLGGDEFAVLSTTVTATLALETLARSMIDTVERSIVVDELGLEVGASIGIARFPDDGVDPNTLLRHADVAMYAAKAAHTGWKFYSPNLDRNSVRKLNVLSDFRRALERDEIVAYFQPIVDVVGTRVRGAEALVRWEHPERGLLAPGAFVETIEQTGLIAPMTRVVLERAVDQCAQWRRAGHDLSVAVNLSVRNLLDRDLPNQVDHILDVYGLPPEALQLEITESMVMSDPERVLATVARLNDLGVRLSVDDFGTGYSSLANLRQMPIDELKIDRSFVSPMLQGESDLIIVRSTINLGHDLGLRVIAEGVEDEPTLTRLARLGCDLAQGYHVSRPLPADSFSQWLGEDLRPSLALVS